jgi:hypothetical protein
LTAAAAVLLLACGAAPGAVPGGEAFGVGVLRRDGIIVPFAAFDGKRWIDNWPLPDAEPDVPISLRNVPPKWWGPTRPLERWQAWVPGGPQSLRVVQPDWVNVHCTRQIGLRTDYQPPFAAPPRDMQPYPKDGLAVSPPQTVDPIAVVSPTSDEARALTPFVLDAFNAAERKVEDRYGHPLTRRAREGRVPDIEAVYAIGDHPGVYYVEASRVYRRLGQSADTCEAVAFGTGWFTRDGDQVRSLDTVVDLLPCNRAGASYMLPLGAMRVNGKQFWLAQFSGWDRERFVVIEIKQKAVRAAVNVWGGSC